MAEGWKQVLEDMRAALLGKTQETKPPAEISPEDAGETSEGEASPSGAATVPETEVVSPETIEAQPGFAADALAETGTDQTAVTSPLDHDLANTNSILEAQPAAPGEAVVTGHKTTPTLAPERTQQRRWRSIFGPIILFIAGAWFVYSSGLWARWTAPKAPAPDVVATFDGGQITLAGLEAHLAQLEGSEVGDHSPLPEEILLVLEDMVMDELVSRWAAGRQPESEETFSHTMQHINEELNLQALEGQLHEGDIPVLESEIQAYYNENRALFGDQPLTAVREQIRQTLVAEKEQDYVTNYIEQLKDNASVTRFFELLDVPSPTEDDLRRYYEENRDQFALPRQVTVDELQFRIGEDETAARQAADDALLQLRSGANFADIPSDIPAAVVTSGATLFAGTRGDEWDTAVFALTEGELSDVFRAGDAFYIVRLQEKQNARTQTFAEVRGLVETAVAPKVMDDWLAANANKTLFTIKSNRYIVGEFYQEYQELPFTVQAQFAGPEGMKDLAERLIERLLLVADANERLLDVENQELADEARLQILKQMLHQEEVDDKIEITDEEIQQYYQENQELMAFPPQARIRYIRIGLGNSEDEAASARQRADEAYEKLAPGLFQDGEDFSAVAQEYSEDPETAANGGEMPGWIGESGDILAEFEMHPFHEAVAGLQVDEISPPFEFGGSLYIVQVIERTEPETVDMEEARPFIEEILTQQKHEDLEIALQDQLLEQANFEIYWPVLETYLQQLPTPEPFFLPFATPSS
ncbi:MAG: hypothetical protein CL608_25855 [Anaerolineaceae bacterium]|nr:hypothetical protein [Anaerolineaceae bacterium]